MKITDTPLLTDENIDPSIVGHLRKLGFDVFDIVENGLAGSDDETILDLANQQKRVVVTHDSAFGTLVIASGKPFAGIIYLKPGHIQTEFHITSIKALLEKVEEVTIPFIVVVFHSQAGIRIRYRQK